MFRLLIWSPMSGPPPRRPRSNWRCPTAPTWLVTSRRWASGWETPSAAALGWPVNGWLEPPIVWNPFWRGNWNVPRRDLERLTAQLDALSPLRVLERGYSVARDSAGRVLRRRADFAAGRAFTLRVIDGDIPARVEDGQ